MSECKHEKSNYHYYMEEICECGYKRVMDEDEAEDKVVTTIVYSKDKVQNSLIRENNRLKVDLDSEKAMVEYATERYLSAEKRETDIQAANARAEARVNVLVGALGIALHELTTSHNLLATDRPDMLMANNEEGGIWDITWMIDNSRVIEVIKQALAKAKEGDSNGFSSINS